MSILKDRHLAGDNCSYCDKPLVEIGEGPRAGNSKSKDHLIPRTFAIGTDRNLHLTDIAAGRGNGVWCCNQCNQLKGDMLPDQIRVLAEAHRERAKLLDLIADRSEAIIKDRGLDPWPALKEREKKDG